MNLLGMPLNKRMILWFGMHGLIIIDIILITYAMIFSPAEDLALRIMIFDFVVCIILLIEWSYNFYLSSPKSLFLKDRGNWLSLIASIPFDVILPAVIPGVGLLRYLRLLKFLRIIVLFSRFHLGITDFLEKSRLDKIIVAILFTIVLFTFLLWLFGPTYGLYDDFYFVMVTLTTVGYGDIIPVTLGEKVISLALIIVGVFVFSTITAAISSYLTDKLIDDEGINESLEQVKEDMDKLHRENDELKAEIRELKELIEKNK